MRRPITALAVFAALLPGAVRGEVTGSGEAGFVTRDQAFIAAAPAEIWAVLVDPARYWNPQHSWSLDGGNFTLDPVAGGCFCEALPGGENGPGGSVEHMRVLHAAPGRLLRMTGALGPLQSEALAATLTVSLDSEEGGTRVVWEYVVGGYARFDLGQIAPAVDQVQSEQLARLAAEVTRAR